MKSFPFRLIFLLIVMELSGLEVKAQNYCLNRRNLWLNYGAGIGYTQYQSTSTIGAKAKLGYQKEFKNKRFRYMPQLGIGAYTSFPFTDERQTWFNTLDFEVMFYADLLKFRSASIVGGISPMVYAILGLQGEGGAPFVNGSKYIKGLGGGGRLCLGLRLNPQKKKYTIDILPLNFQMATGNRLDYFAQVDFNVLLSYR